MSKRETLIVAIWKEKLTYKQSVAAVKRIAQGIQKKQWPFLIGIAPNPFAYVGVANELRDTGMRLVAQNILWEAESGSFIGEVTSSMLGEVGCDYVIVGHSERRRYFHEDDNIIARKAEAAIAAGAKPILCIGDSKEEKEAGKTADVLRRQLTETFDRLGSVLNGEQLLIAYEPVWAISTWRSNRPLPEGAEIAELHAHIRAIITELVGSSLANSIPLIYGGSVSGDNAADYFSYEETEGALVGGASKTPESFLATLAAAKRGMERRASKGNASIHD